MIRVVVIGSGAVAEQLTSQIAGNSQLTLVQLFARNEQRGKLLAREVSHKTYEVEWTNNPNRLAMADLYILAVSDRAVGALSESLPLHADAVVAHTAGSVAIDELSNAIAHRAVLYPLQTFTAGRTLEDFRQIPFFIEAATPHALAVVSEVAKALSDNIIEMSSPQRARLHLVGAWANNFTNLMFTIAEEIAQDAGVSLDCVHPLMNETLRKAVEMPSPELAQTGPAKRGDTAIQAKHIELLEAQHPEYVELYKMLSKTICNKTLKRNLPR